MGCYYYHYHYWSGRGKPYMYERSQSLEEIDLGASMDGRFFELTQIKDGASMNALVSHACMGMLPD